MSSTKASTATRPIDRLIFDVFAPASDPATPQPPVTANRDARRRQGSVKAGLVVIAAGLLGALALAAPALFGGTSTSAVTAPSITVVSGQASPASAAKSTASTTATAPTTAPTGVSVAVAEQGFTRLAPEADGDRKVAYAAVLRNPSSDQIALDVRALVTFTGRGGATLKVEDEKLDAILPGQTGAIAGDTEQAGVTGIRVNIVGVGRWAPANGFDGRLDASGVRTTRVAGRLITTATLRSTLARNIAKADAVAVYFDRSGRVIGGQSEGIDFIPANGSVPVTLDTSKALRGIARTEVYANTDPFEIDD